MNIAFRTNALSLVFLGSFVGIALADGIDEPIPSYYQEPGLSRTRDYINQHANERIDPFTGKLQWHYVDLLIPGNGGLDLKVQRSYTSLNEDVPELSPAGLGWTMHFGRVIRKATVGICFNGDPAVVNPVLELPDGSRRILYSAPVLAGASFITTDFWKAQCAANGNGLDVFSPDGTRYEMTRQGHSFGSPSNTQNTYYVSRITDRNNNSINFTYQSLQSGILAVTGASTSDGRSLTFSYANSALASVTDGSRTWTYTHIASPVLGYTFLSRVTRPGGTAWQYSYNTGSAAGQFSMQQAVYPTGGTVNYTYGFVFFAQNPSIPRSTVVSQKVANPGGTWTWSYQPATQPMSAPNGIPSWSTPANQGSAPTADRTIVNGPNESRAHYHFGYNSAGSGTVYAIGSLLGTSNSLETETYGLRPFHISNQENRRPGGTLVIDPTTSAVLVTARSISRSGESFSISYGNFDGFGNPRTITESGTNSRTTNLTYFTNTAKWIVRGIKDDETISEGGQTLTITRVLDTNANMQSETRAGVITSFTYSAQGDVASRTDARGKRTDYLDYFRGIPRTENQPAGVTLVRTVSSAGNVTSERDGELHTTSFGYDGLNRVTSITRPQGNAVSVAWGTNTRTVTRGAHREITTYDGFGRETSIQHTDTARGITITHNYQVDSLGRRVFASYPNSGLGTKFEYDLLHRPTFVRHEFNPGNGSFTSSRQYGYTSNQIRVTNERGLLFVFNHRSYGDPDKRELVGIVGPGNVGNTSISRNIAGQITSVTQGSITRSYGYDSRFYLTSISEPETGTTTFGRDAAGNMISRAVGSSGTTTFGYDDQNRLTSISYPNPARNVTQGWNRNHKLISGATPSTSRSWSYDANNNLTREDLSIAGNSFSIVYGYDGNDQLNQITYPNSGSVVTYSPDALGRPTSATPFLNSVTHHANGQINTISHANGVTTSMGQDNRQRPSTIQTSSYINLAYGYDHANNVISITDSANSNNNRTLGYDEIDRLTSVNGFAISYDGTGNILQQNFGGTLNYAYDSQNRLASTSGVKAYTFSYDVYGNVAGNGVATFEYDDAPNLLCVNCASPNRVDYDYDAKGMRVLTRKNNVTTYSMYGGGGELMFEFEPSRNLSREHIYLKGQRVATRTNMVPFSTTTSIVASASQVRPGQTVVLAATVSGQNPTGTVTFSDNGTTIGTATITNGSATFTTAGLSFGLHNFTASYGGDANNFPSSTGAPAVVRAGTISSTSLVSSASQVPSGGTVVLTATVSGDSPTGTVTFFRDGASIGTATVASGTASLTTAPLPRGVYSFTATYGGDVNNSSSATTSPVQVTAGTASSTSLAASSSQVEPGQAVTLTATVSGASPTGTVNFFRNGVLMGGAPLVNGTATFTSSPLPFGFHSFTATYDGDASNFPSSSPSVQVVSGNVVPVLMQIINSILLDD